jgi:hypothetical protein
MIESQSRLIQFRGKPAELSVIRNDAQCWGRVRRNGGHAFDVVTREDHYADSDDDALDAFERAMADSRNLYVALAWL